MHDVWGIQAGWGTMRGLSVALALAATVAFAPGFVANFVPGAAADGAAIFRIIELKGSAVKWGSPRMGTGARVTYAFATEAVEFPNARNCRAMVPMDELLASSGIDQALYEAETAKAFEAWAAVADIEFQLVNDAATADILIGAQARPIGRAFTNVSFAGSAAHAVRPLDRSLICLNPEHSWKVGFDGNLDVYDLRYTLKHEIGHAIGLDHPGTTSQVMSYRYEERFRQLQPGDIRGAVALYGSTQNLMVETPGSQPASARAAAGWPALEEIQGAPALALP
jgi:hypothetical protein